MKVQFHTLLPAAVVWLACGVLLAEDKSDKEALKQVFQYLHLYWGTQKYSENYQQFFLGQKPKVNFITQDAMLKLLGQLCKENKVHCNPHPESVIGKNLPNGRIAIVHALVHPLFEALFIVHELEHDRDDQKKSSAENEIQARMIEKDFLRVLFGNEWFNETVNVLATHSDAISIGDYVYRDPTDKAINILAERFRNIGVELELNEHHKGILRNSVMFLANDRQTLTHSYFVANFKIR